MTPTQPCRLRVAIIDDSADVRTAIRNLLNAAPDMTCAGVYAGIVPALSGLINAPADLALVDLRMPEIDGGTGLPMLRSLFPDTHLLVLTMFQEDDDIFRALANGANGYLLKSDPPESLLAGIRDVVSGGAPMSPAIARRVVQTLQRPLQSPDNPVLTTRELAILTLLRAGRGYKGTAADLGISVDTVRTHIRSIYQKLRVHSLIEALAKTRP
jgi:DNA-binding NarL/FixJ family response regulator